MVCDYSDKHTIVVNAFGGAGAGKTTACFHICSELKKKGYVTEYASEYAKELVWEKRYDKLDGTLDNQREIYAEQKKRIDRVIGQVDFVITDSPLLLNSIYLSDCPEKSGYTTELIDDFKKYDNFNLVIKRDEGKYEKEGRIHTFEESVEVDKFVVNMLTNNHIYFGTYTHDKLDTVVNNIIKHYNAIIQKEELLMEQDKNVIMWREVAKFEEILEIPKEQRITEYNEAKEEYQPALDVTESQIESRFKDFQQYNKEITAEQKMQIETVWREVANFEKILEMPMEMRITGYDSSKDRYYPLKGVTSEQIESRFKDFQQYNKFKENNFAIDNLLDSIEKNDNRRK